MTTIDGLKLKHDVADLMKKAPEFVTHENIERITEDVKQFRNGLANSNFEIQQIKDNFSLMEKQNASTLKETN